MHDKERGVAPSARCARRSTAKARGSPVRWGAWVGWGLWGARCGVGVGGGRRGWPSTEGVGWVGVPSRVRRVVVSTAVAWSACVACVEGDSLKLKL